MTDTSTKIIGGALTEELSEIAYHKIHKDDLSPLDVARSLLTVAANVSAKHLGIKSTAALFRTFAALAEEKLSKRTN